MSSNVIFSDEFLSISIENNDVFIETYKKGFPMERLSSILAQHPEIGLTSAIVLRNSIALAPVKPQKIGELKERIQLEVAPSGMTATVTFNLSMEDLAPASRKKLVCELNSLLSRNGIVYGINSSILLEELKSGIPYIIAEGTSPIDGTDAIVKMYELMKAQPEIRKDGSVDFYELKLINRVKPGDWLGERIEATDGIPGKTVKGEIIKQLKGKNIVLNYDKNTVSEISTSKKTTLYSRLNGAVNYTDGKLGVSTHLEIDGDVGVSTGNIKFDGFLTIKGTVNDGFSVEATKDIEINGAFGLGSPKSLVSTAGSIYVKGGISAKDHVEIRSKKNVFIKFADNVQIICGETAHIGYYCLNSRISAREIIFDATNGQAIGGHIKAEIHISVPIAGSDMERKTTLEVLGFNRQVLIDRLNEVFHSIGEKKAEQQKLKQQSSSSGGAGHGAVSESNGVEKLYRLKDEIRSLEEERKNIAGYLKTKGNGEISITRRLYPNCSILLNGMSAEIPSDTIAATFYLNDGEIKLQ